MAARGAAQVLRERIGHEATDALITMMNESNRSMAEEIVRTIGDRSERRMAEEVSTLRVEMHKGFGEMRAEIAGVRADVIRWSFLFWVSQVGVIAGLLAYMK